jgi:hypothetical protein
MILFLDSIKTTNNDIQKAFNRLASIARENLRQISRIEDPTVKELWESYKGIEILGKDELPIQLINGKDSINISKEKQLKLISSIERFKEETRNVVDKPLKKIYKINKKRTFARGKKIKK